MANRRIEMHQYRQVIHCMRLGQSDRAIARDKLIGRRKCAIVRVIAEQNGWLSGPLPDDEQIAIMLEAVRTPGQNQPSLTQPFDEKIRQWEKEGVQATTIYEALVSQFGFTGSYSSVRRRIRKIRCIVDPIFRTIV